MKELEALSREINDNYFYELANDWEEEAIQHGENSEYLKSWAVSTEARLPFLADAIVSVVSAPLAFIGILFGLVPAIVTWGKEAELLKFSSKKFVEKMNHLCISTFGTIISPWVAHKVRDANVSAGFLTAFALMGREFNRRTVFAVNLN